LSEPWVYRAMHQGKRLELSELAHVDAHLHGGLRLDIGGRAVPGLGYWGPGDVCIGMWGRELYLVRQVLSTSADGRHVFDEGEQGQPAYVFEKRGDTTVITLAASQVDGEAVPEWQEVPCSTTQLLAAIDGLLRDLRSLLDQAIPGSAADWWRRNITR